MLPENITLPYGNDRFWAKVEVEGPDGCWLWTAATDDWGYGVFGWFDGKNQKAHRIVFAHLHGPIPAGMKVCHTCDTPSCVNPAHLFLGTDKDNQDDALRKGRRASQRPDFASLLEQGEDHWTHRRPGDSPIIGTKGESNPGAKLTEESVREIRRRYAAGDISQTALAKKHGVSQTVIFHLLARNTWRHVEDDPDMPPTQPRQFASRKGELSGHAKITADDVTAIRARYAAGGISMKALGREFGVSAPSVCLIVQRKTWTHVL
jgi:hypothetical protein